MLLASVAIALLVIFNGNTTALIPLYSVGVFVSFTISQAGMVRHWLKERGAGYRFRLAINGFGCVLTGIVAVVVTVGKAPTSLLVAVIIPILVAMMLFINRQYKSTTEQLAVHPGVIVTPTRREHRAVVPVPGINRAVIQAVNVARSFSSDVLAVHITEDPDEANELRRQWQTTIPGLPLVVVESPYRALTGPLLAYLEVLDRAWPADKEKPITFVVIPEFVARTWWERLLYNQSVRQLKTALLGRPHTVVVNVPYRREDADDEDDAGEARRRPAPTLRRTSAADPAPPTDAGSPQG